MLFAHSLGALAVEHRYEYYFDINRYKHGIILYSFAFLLAQHLFVP